MATHKRRSKLSENRRPISRSLRFEPLEDRRMLAAVVSINSTGDGNVRDAFLTLREAILVNNRTLAVASLSPQEQAQISGAPTASDTDTIRFAIPGAGPHTISPTSALPNISDPVIIDGYTQSGASANSNAANQALDTVLRIELAGNLAPTTTGLRLATGSSGSTIRGLDINRFSNNIWIDSSGNTIAGNFIGTNVAGTAALAGTANGVLLISAANNTIGGANPADSNLISGNGSNGITIVETGANNNIIRGNLIGTDITGRQDLGNSTHGIFLFRAQGTLIGGSAAGAGNVISGNNNTAIWIDADSHDAVIQGNLIGTEVVGSGRLGNSNYGIITLNSSQTTIGGLAAGEGNVIAASGNIAINMQNAVAPIILGNSIGTDVSGTLNLGNLGGIFLSSVRDSTIQANIVAFNGSGIQISGNTFGDPEIGNLISRNSIHSNTSAVAIDLFSSFETIGPDFPQDLTDADTGANNHQNFPIITSVTDMGSFVRVVGSLTSQLNSDYRLEFFSSAAPTSSGFGPGEMFLDDLDLSIGGGSNTIGFSIDLPNVPAGQPYITATATDITNVGGTPRNNTSEFSPAVPADTVFQVTSTADDGGGSLRLALDAANFIVGKNTITFNIPANDPNHLYYRNDGIAGQVSKAMIATTTATNDASIADIDPDWTHSWFSIESESQLFITDEIIIDGYTQPGAVANSNAAGQGLNSVLKVEINGELAQNLPQLNGLIHLQASNSTIRGLVINRTDGQKIQLTSGGNNRLEGNYIGPDVSGTLSFSLGDNAFPPTFAGVGTNIANPASPITGNHIGGVTPAARNLISSNFTGVAFFAVASNNFVEGNLIGTDRSGTRSVENKFGVWIESVGNVVGGSAAGARNVISGNEVGIQLSDFFDNSHDNVIENNVLGLDVAGAALENALAVVSTGSDRNQIIGNTIAFNGLTKFAPSLGFGGIRIVGVGNLISRNSIHSNQGVGIDLRGVDGVDLNDIPPESDPPDQDTGGNNLQNYPVINSAIASGGGTQVQGTLASTPNSNFRIELFSNAERDDNPFIGYGQGRPFEFGEGQTHLGFVNVTTNSSGNASFTANVAALPLGEEFLTATATDVTNTGSGPQNDTSAFSVVYPIGGPSTVVTKTGDAGVGTLREAIIVATLAGIPASVTFAIPPNDPRHFYYQNDGVAEQVSRANIATTTAANDASIAGIDPDWAHSWYSVLPTHDLPQIDAQVHIDGYSQTGSSRNSLVGPGPLNTVLKIELDGSLADGHGLNFEVGSEFTVIEGLAINRFGGSGIFTDTIGANRIYGNFIGIDVSGSIALGNGLDGIHMRGDAINRVGGASPEMRNLVSGNARHGIQQQDWGGGRIQGNLVGTDRTGSRTLANGDAGIYSDRASFTTIGGTAPSEGNLIATAGTSAIQFVDRMFPDLNLPELPLSQFETYRVAAQAVFNSREAFFQTNTEADAIAVFTAILNLIDVLADDGITDLYPQANAILGNRIFVPSDLLPEIGGLGIDLVGDGVTANDPLDADGGPNNLRNFPILTSAQTNGGTTTVAGSYNSVPNVPFRIEFFASDQVVSSSHRPGEQFLGSTTVTTNASGNATFSFVIPSEVAEGRFITATASYLLDLDLSAGTPLTPIETSEFSHPIIVGKLTGDYNGNGTADAADYTFWRDTLGSTTDLRANGDDSNNVIDSADYGVWRTSFGNTLGSGGAAQAGGSQPPESLVSNVTAGVEFTTTDGGERGSPAIERGTDASVLPSGSYSQARMLALLDLLDSLPSPTGEADFGAWDYTAESSDAEVRDGAAREEAIGAGVELDWP